MYNQLNKHHTNTLSKRIKELKEQYESNIIKCETYQSSLLTINDNKSSNQRRVKQIMQMFNNTKDMMKSINNDFKFKRFDNTLSLPSASSASSASSPIVPKLRNKFLLNDNEKEIKNVSAVGATSKSFCLVTESAFNKLSVKDRVKLYTKFIEDLSNGRTNFNTKHFNNNDNNNNNNHKNNNQSNKMNNKNAQQLNLIEKDVSVKFILQKFENQINSRKSQYYENEYTINEDLKQMEKSFEYNVSFKNEISPLKELFYKWLSDHDNSSNNASDKAFNEPESVFSYSDSDSIKSSTMSNTDEVHETSSLKSTENDYDHNDNNKNDNLIATKTLEDYYENVTSVLKSHTNYEETANNSCIINDDDVSNHNTTSKSKYTKSSKCDVNTTIALTEMEDAANNDQVSCVIDTKEYKEKCVRQAVKEFIMEESAIMSLSENSADDISLVKPIKNYTGSESGLSSLPKMSSDDSPDDKTWKFGKKLKQRFSLSLTNRSSKEKTVSPNFVDSIKTKKTIHRKSNYIKKLFSSKKNTTTMDEPTFVKRHDNSMEKSESPEKIITKKKRSLRRKSSNYIKKLFGSKKLSTDDQIDDSTFMKHHKDLMRAMNSPRKIDAAYTLTCLTPSPPTIKAKIDEDNNKAQSQYQPQLNDINITTNDKNGFKTEREMGYPVCKSKLNFSTPIKDHKTLVTRTPPNTLLPLEENLIISPIVRKVKTWPRSYREINSTCQRNSLPMQVIHEDEPINYTTNYAMSPPSLLKRYSLYSTDSAMSYALPYVTAKKSIVARSIEKVSEFWIKCGDFTFIFDVDYEAPEKLHWKYEMFSKVSMETRQTYFGIDNYMFTWNQPVNNNDSYIRSRPPSALQCRNGSHYWVTTGNLAIPFNGLHLNSQKIKSYFHFIATAVQETKILKFGVDNVDFSKIPEFIYSTPKLSLESNFSQLIGLQATPTKNLSEIQTNQWPRIHAKFLKETSDKDSKNYKRKSIATTTPAKVKMNPFISNNTFDLSSVNGNGNYGSGKWFTSLKNEFESAPIEDLFQQKLFKQKTFDKLLMMANIQHMKKNLFKLQNRLNHYRKPENLSFTIIDDLKGSPEYFIKLKTLTKNIKELCDKNVLQNCTKQELENYMYVLTRYTDICLSDCISNIDKIYDALEDKSDIYV